MQDVRALAGLHWIQQKGRQSLGSPRVSLLAVRPAAAALRTQDPRLHAHRGLHRPASSFTDVWGCDRLNTAVHACDSSTDLSAADRGRTLSGRKSPTGARPGLDRMWRLLVQSTDHCL